MWLHTTPCISYQFWQSISFYGQMCYPSSLVWSALFSSAWDGPFKDAFFCSVGWFFNSFSIHFYSSSGRSMEVLLQKVCVPCQCRSTYVHTAVRRSTCQSTFFDETAKMSINLTSQSTKKVAQVMSLWRLHWLCGMLTIVQMRLNNALSLLSGRGVSAWFLLRSVVTVILWHHLQHLHYCLVHTGV